MSRQAALSQREFDTWRQEDAAFKREMREYITAQTGINLTVEGRMSTVEEQQKECAESVSRRTTWVSSLVSAVMGAIAGAFAGGMR